jgi:hypothetical protein
MKQLAVLPFLLLFAAACGSYSDNATAKLIKPDLAIEQLGQTTYSGRDHNMSPNVGAAPVNLRLLVRNNSNENIHLKRIEIVSVGRGAYTVDNQAKPYKVDIAPEQTEAVEIWVPTVVQNSVSGAQGPVTLRVTAYFDSPVGQFREIYIRTVNDPMSPGPATR